MTLVERTVEIVNPHGIHARPASEFVKAASRFKAEISVGKDGIWVNGKSIMGVMTLAAERGSAVTVRAEGDDAEAAVDALIPVLERVWTDDV
jgi:phosphocarrier protein HPr